MKRYIRAYTFIPDIDIDYSIFDGTPFKCDTGTSFGNDFLNKKDLAYRQESKNRTGKIVMMTPEEYYEECSEHAWSNYVPVDKLKSQRKANEGTLEYLKNLLDRGGKFDLPYINKADHGQEGLHRMMVAGDIYGWDTKFPVLVIDVYDEQVEADKKKKEAAYDFRNEEFPELCHGAEIRLMDIDIDDAKSMDVLETYRKCILNEYGFWRRYLSGGRDWKFGGEDPADIQISFEFEVVDGTVKVWLTNFGGFDFDGYLAVPYETELSELKYKLYEYDKYWEPDLDDIEPEDLTDEDINATLPDDLSDSSLEKFFFKDKPEQ